MSTKTPVKAMDTHPLCAVAGPESTCGCSLDPAAMAINATFACFDTVNYMLLSDDAAVDTVCDDDDDFLPDMYVRM